MIDLLITNMRENNKKTTFDIAIQDRIIVETGKGLDHPSSRIIDGNGDLLSPGFVESHVHLDIALMNDPGKPGRPEPYVSHYALSDSLEKRRRYFSPEDIVN